MKNINSYRTFTRNSNEPNPDGEYVLYWMQINRRLHYNYALEYAVAWANKLNKPLLIYEALSVDYPWASDRFHKFIMQGMKENLEQCAQQGVSIFTYIEPTSGGGKGLFYQLADRACTIISDEYPVYIIKQHNERVAPRLSIPYITVDSNGIIPLGVTEKAPYSAYIFRKVMQKHFREGYEHPPKENPLDDLINRDEVVLPSDFLASYPLAEPFFEDMEQSISGLPIDHTVGFVDMDGTRAGALERLDSFIRFDLMEYDEMRNHPDAKKASGLSPWLHFGKISEYEIVKAALQRQPAGWSLDNLTANGGKNTGFFNGDKSVQGFLDEVITWREVGFHFAHHVPDYDKFESLPDWVHKTLDEHRQDKRQYVYSLEELAESRTHDEIWNAAQTELRTEGKMHNYLRMLWGKKIIEWTPDYETALEYLIELNNKYAVDGRDPNSYSGIFWCLGRFDRAWTERPVFGKLRFMSSDSTRKKIKMKEYLARYSVRQKSLI
ncbi:MAG: hypothetical protein AAFW89_11440 [Bacteroidota bacterium]